jgi:hypothetical protein
VLIAGEAGIGKSPLIAEFGSRATGLGPSVLTGGCVALVQGELAYAPLVEALRGLLGVVESAALTGLLADDRGNRRSLSAFGRPYPAAYTQWRQAEALLYQRVAAGQAKPPLQAAHATALRLGARPCSPRLRRWLGERGSACTPHTPRPRNWFLPPPRWWV